MPRSLKVLKEMVEAALKEKAPRTYRELEKSGNLEQFLSERAGGMWEAYGQEHVQVCSEAGKAGWEAKDGLRAIQDQYAALSRLTEQVLTTWLEFEDPPITESSPER